LAQVEQAQVLGTLLVAILSIPHLHVLDVIVLVIMVPTSELLEDPVGSVWIASAEITAL
jgi:hypothetical protein